MADQIDDGDSAFERLLDSIPKKAGDLHAEILLLTCIDYRFFTLIAKAMKNKGWEGKYDHFILAGAALGAQLDFNNDHLPEPKPPRTKPALPRIHWQQVFVEHLQIATQLHEHIKTVMIIEHRECGAYEEFIKPGLKLDRVKEREEHKKFADNLEKLIHKVKPGMKVTKWLASLKPKRTVDPLDWAARSEGTPEREAEPELDLEEL